MSNSRTPSESIEAKCDQLRRQLAIANNYIELLRKEIERFHLALDKD